MIKLEKVTKKYGNTIALNSISFSVDKGNIVGLLGPNGAGKSTTMKIITGYIVPDSGSIEIDGQKLQDDSVDLKKSIGYMPENNPLYKDMLVFESLNYILDLYNIYKDRKEKIDQVVNSTGIKDVFYKEISELSKGYKQRVGLAQVLITDPKVLILDEPTEGLDPNQRHEIRSLIKNISQDKTILISTHIMQEVEAICNKVIIINKGQILFDGDIEELKQKNTSHNLKIKIKNKDADKLVNFLQSNQNLKVDKLINKKYDTNSNIVDLYVDNLNDDFYKKLFSIIVENNFVVYEITLEKQNLEDVFRNLTLS